VPSDDGHKYAIADMITGYGVAQSVKHYYDLYKGEDLNGKRVIIQGWGNVASAAACYLSQMGAVITGIIDIAGAIIRPEGLSLEAIKELFYSKDGNKLYAEEMISFEEAKDKIWSVGAEVFIPGAASKIVTKEQVDTMIANGLEVISCGANVPFVDDQVFFGPTANYTDTKISLIPDFIANCGMARVFAFLMQDDIEMTDEAIFEDTSNVIFNALKELKGKSNDLTGISSRAMEVSLGKLA
jgi:glutamate dehydrogenase/leucine dehydrogenase